MDFRITGLDAREFAYLAGMSDEELARHRAVRSVCDSRPGFPCRVSLEDAEPGEEVLLVSRLLSVRAIDGRGCFAARIDRPWPRYPCPKTASVEPTGAR